MNIYLKITVCLLFVKKLEAATVPPTNLLAGRKYCGYQHIDDYPRPNHQISLDEFPWMAQLLYDESKKILCGGSLINNLYVLTAAHCLFNPYVDITGVRLGDHNVTSEKDCVKDDRLDEECNDPAQEYDIEEKIRHPDYIRKTFRNDIGLVRLSRKVEYSEYIRPICLPQSESIELKDGQRLAISGWGQTSFGGSQTEVKKKISTVVISLEQCQKFFENASIVLTINNICATEGGVFTCQGDSGGPLMHYNKNQWEQVGILLYGKACGLPAPTVYLKVNKYVNWIISNLRP